MLLAVGAAAALVVSRSKVVTAESPLKRVSEAFALRVTSVDQRERPVQSHPWLRLVWSATASAWRYSPAVLASFSALLESATGPSRSR